MQTESIKNFTKKVNFLILNNYFTHFFSAFDPVAENFYRINQVSSPKMGEKTRGEYYFSKRVHIKKCFHVRNAFYQ